MKTQPPNPPSPPAIIHGHGHCHESPAPNTRLAHYAIAIGLKTLSAPDAQQSSSCILCLQPAHTFYTIPAYRVQNTEH